MGHCHRSCQKVKICHISVTCHHIITNNASTPKFSGMGNPLVPLYYPCNLVGVFWYTSMLETM